MATPKALVLRAAGTNCDRETEYALQQAGFEAERVHVFRRLAGPLNEFVAAGKLVLGICNGFQVMIKSGLLPWARVAPVVAHHEATLAWNDSGKFEDRWVHLRADSDKCVFLPAGEIVALPIAHGEGKFVPRDESVMERLAEGDQVAVRYVDADGNSGPYPINPNGSVDDIAGICDPSGRVMGLMPHPERFVDVTHHPQWTRGGLRRADGTMFFQRAMDCLK